MGLGAAQILVSKTFEREECSRTWDPLARSRLSNCEAITFASLTRVDGVIWVGGEEKSRLSLSSSDIHFWGSK